MMNTSLAKTFNYADGAIRTAGTTEEPLFCVKDICALLGVKGHRNKVSLLDIDEKLCVETLDAQKRTRPTTFCTEAGFYRIIFSVQKNEKTRAFKRWVFHEVLPSIRKTGEYKLQTELQESQEQLANTQVELARVTEQEEKAQDTVAQLTDMHCWTRILGLRGIESGSFTRTSQRFSRMCRLVKHLVRRRKAEWISGKPYFVSEAALLESQDTILGWRL